MNCNRDFTSLDLGRESKRPVTPFYQDFGRRFRTADHSLGTVLRLGPLKAPTHDRAIVIGPHSPNRDAVRVVLALTQVARGEKTRHCGADNYYIRFLDIFSAGPQTKNRLPPCR